jgi:hypothetical protein
MLFYRLIATLLTLSLCSLLNLAHAKPLDIKHLSAAPYAPDRVLVKFKAGSAASEIGQAHRAVNGQHRSTLESIGVQVIQVPSGDVPAAVKVYQSNPNVLYAEPDYYRLLVMPNEEVGPTPGGGANYFSEQWYLHNDGQDHAYVRSTIFGEELAITSGTVDADINAPAAWDLNTGRATTDSTAGDTPKVAVLDSGAACHTLELEGKCIEQVNEVGLSVGYFDNCSVTDPACDNLGHGTFVSSEVAANTNNGEGMAGTGWDTSVGIFKVCYQELVTDGVNLFTVGLCPVSHSAAAIEKASLDQFEGGLLVRSRYHVITMSYGSDWIDAVGNITPTTPSNAECDAIANAWDRGVVVVAAAGNNGNTTRVYPAACTHPVSGESTVISVAASDHNDDRASFSTYSWPSDPWVSLAAPGEAIFGILPEFKCGIPAGSDSCVNWWDGTSMAAPLVAGGAALVWTDLYEDNAGLAGPGSCDIDGMPCNQVVRERLQNSADSVGANGQDMLSWTQHGRLDLAAAVSDPVPPADPLPVAAFSYNCTGYDCSFDASNASGNGLSYVWDFGVNGATSDTEASTYNYGSSGRYTVSLTITDIEASTSTVSVELNLKNNKRTVSGDVTAGGGDGGDGGDGGSGNCPPGKAAKGKC